MHLDIQSVERIIHLIETLDAPGPEFIPTRYPYTYAYDYLRSHYLAFGLRPNMSRADCAGLFRFSDEKEQICCLLADAYLREHKVRFAEYHDE